MPTANIFSREYCPNKLINMPHGITKKQQAALCQFYFKGFKTGKITQKQYIDWFQQQYHQTLTQPTISDSLHSQYGYLDSKTEELTFAGTVQAKEPQRKVLEDALFEWQQ